MDCGIIIYKKSRTICIEFIAVWQRRCFTWHTIFTPVLQKGIRQFPQGCFYMYSTNSHPMFLVIHVEVNAIGRQSIMQACDQLVGFGYAVDLYCLVTYLTQTILASCHIKYCCRESQMQDSQFYCQFCFKVVFPLNIRRSVLSKVNYFLMMEFICLPWAIMFSCQQCRPL